MTKEGIERTKLGLECLETFMSVMVTLNEDDWNELSLNMGENEQICWQQIELLIDFLKEETK